MIIALIGNQNCGKTTLFNKLTGMNKHVGNFPGVTVDQTVGLIRGKDNIQIVDLPGIYSMTSYSSEETVTRDFIITQKPDAIINICDATNLERNLYLTLQILEMNIPTVLALNMMDELRADDGYIDIKALSESLGVKIVPISAAKNEGIDDLTDAVINVAEKRLKPSVEDFCPQGAIHRCIHAVSLLIEDHAENHNIAPRFAAVKLIEGDSSINEILKLDENEKETVEHAVVEMTTAEGTDKNVCIAKMRYDFIENALSTSYKRGEAAKGSKRSEKIDKIFTNRYLAIPIFICFMLLTFWLSFDVIGAFLSDLLTMGIDALTNVVATGLDAAEVNPVMRSLIVDGIFTGVGSVISFLPIVVVLFFFLSVLEDTGYMARVAFVMDKLLRKIGLSGRSIVPLLIGFGCSVPAIMATRTLSSDRDRKMTALLVPYMSCSAKIPVYAMFCTAFFASYRALVMCGLYVFGIIIGIISALILKKTKYAGNSSPFIMELPNYRLPSPKSVITLMWEKAKDFLKKAFTVIFVATIIVWFLQTFDYRFNVAAEGESLLALIGRLLTPIFAPIGLGDWRIVASLVSGFTAKEAVISTLAVLMNTGADGLSAVLYSTFTIPMAFSFLVFTLLYTPCIAAINSVRREFGGGMTAAVIILQCVTAYAAAFLVYSVARLFTDAAFGLVDYILLGIIFVAFVFGVISIIKTKKKCGGTCDTSSCEGCNACSKAKKRRPRFL